jgi:hypothetical protein
MLASEFSFRYFCSPGTPGTPGTLDNAFFPCETPPRWRVHDQKLETRNKELNEHDESGQMSKLDGRKIAPGARAPAGVQSFRNKEPETRNEKPGTDRQSS